MTDPCGDATYSRHCPPRFGFASKERSIVSGIIGPGSSATSLFVTRAAAIYEVPTIAYSASSDELSDKNRFPFFFRTVPSDRFLCAMVTFFFLLSMERKHSSLFYCKNLKNRNNTKITLESESV